MDWKKLIHEIQETGLSQWQIGLILNRSQVWVSDTSRGKYIDLKWTEGQALIELHKKRIRLKLRRERRKSCSTSESLSNLPGR